MLKNPLLHFKMLEKDKKRTLALAPGCVRYHSVNVKETAKRWAAHGALAMSALVFVCGDPTSHARQVSNVGSICNLQEATPGTHLMVRISGVYGPGLDHTVLVDAECPTVSTWVELALRSQENKKKLRKLLDRSRQAHVVVEGEFYGPPLPDPKLPEAIKNQYHPGWGISRHSLQKSWCTESIQLMPSATLHGSWRKTR